MSNKRKVIDIIRECRKGDPFYGILPPMFYDGETKKNYIYTIVRTPREYTSENKVDPVTKKPYVLKVEKPTSIRLYLVFDIMNKLIPESLSVGKVTVMPYYGIACLTMDSESRSVIEPLYYMELGEPFEKYLHTSSETLIRESYNHNGVSSAVEIMGYQELLKAGLIPSAVDEQLSHGKLTGWYKSHDVVNYIKVEGQEGKVRNVTSETEFVPGILDGISMKHVYQLK